MNPETLRKLLLDRALGELSSEAAELLDAYLEQNPDAAKRAAALAETTRIARLALFEEAIPTRPESETIVPGPARWRTKTIGQPWWSRPETFRLAACIALAMGAGWIGGAALNEPTALPTADLASKSPAIVETEPIASAPEAWPLRIAVRPESLVASANRTSGRIRLRWESPMKKPLLEEIP